MSYVIVQQSRNRGPSPDRSRGPSRRMCPQVFRMVQPSNPQSHWPSPHSCGAFLYASENPARKLLNVQVLTTAPGRMFPPGPEHDDVEHSALYLLLHHVRRSSFEKLVRDEICYRRSDAKLRWFFLYRVFQPVLSFMYVQNFEPTFLAKLARLHVRPGARRPRNQNCLFFRYLLRGDLPHTCARLHP